MNRIFIRICSLLMVCFFTVETLIQPANAQFVTYSANLPAATQSLSLSEHFSPVMIRGMKFNPQDGLSMSLIVDAGDTVSNDPKEPSGDEGFLYKESEKLIKYFLTALTVPEKDLWVNLSPYEKDRMTSDALAQTAMGEELLAQDYILKKITASLLAPDDETGKTFWEKIHARAYELYGTTDVPIDTFHKIWIMPAKAEVFAQGDTVLILDSGLKVMLEEDYLAKERASIENAPKTNETSEEAKKIMRNVILPVIADEVNHGKNFAPLRQIFHALILARWYKDNLKQSILGQVYSDRSKVSGVDQDNKQSLEEIYNQYLKAFKSGAEGLIKEEYDPQTQSVATRKYVTGGFKNDLAMMDVVKAPARQALRNFEEVIGDHPVHEALFSLKVNGVNQAMMNRKQFIKQMTFMTLVLFLLPSWVKAAIFKGPPTLQEIIDAYRKNSLLPATKTGNFTLSGKIVTFVAGKHGKGEELALSQLVAAAKPENNGQIRQMLSQYKSLIEDYKKQIVFLQNWDRTADAQAPIFLEIDPKGISNIIGLIYSMAISQQQLSKLGFTASEIEDILILMHPVAYAILKEKIKPHPLVGVDPGHLKQKYFSAEANYRSKSQVLLNAFKQRNLKDLADAVNAVFMYSFNNDENLFPKFKDQLTREFGLSKDLYGLYDEMSASLDALLAVLKERNETMVAYMAKATVMFNQGGIGTVGNQHAHGLSLAAKNFVAQGKKVDVIPADYEGIGTNIWQYAKFDQLYSYKLINKAFALKVLDLASGLGNSVVATFTKKWPNEKDFIGQIKGKLGEIGAARKKVSDQAMMNVEIVAIVAVSHIVISRLSSLLLHKLWEPKVKIRQDVDPAERELGTMFVRAMNQKYRVQDNKMYIFIQALREESIYNFSLYYFLSHFAGTGVVGSALLAAIVFALAHIPIDHKHKVLSLDSLLSRFSGMNGSIFLTINYGVVGFGIGVLRHYFHNVFVNEIRKQRAATDIQNGFSGENDLFKSIEAVDSILREKTKIILLSNIFGIYAIYHLWRIDLLAAWSVVAVELYLNKTLMGAFMQKIREMKIRNEQGDIAQEDVDKGVEDVMKKLAERRRNEQEDISQEDVDKGVADVLKRLEERRRNSKDSAMLSEAEKVSRGTEDLKGGVDLNTSEMDFKSSGSIDHAVMQKININPNDVIGVVPVNITIIPIKDVNMLLGLDGEGDASSSDNQKLLAVFGGRRA